MKVATEAAARNNRLGHRVRELAAELGRDATDVAATAAAWGSEHPDQDGIEFIEEWSDRLRHAAGMAFHPPQREVG